MKLQQPTGQVPARWSRLPPPTQSQEAHDKQHAENRLDDLRVKEEHSLAMELLQGQYSIEELINEGGDDNAGQPNTRKFCYVRNGILEDENNEQAQKHDKCHDEEGGVCKLIQLLLIEIIKAHADSILYSQTNNGPKESRVCNK